MQTKMLLPFAMFAPSFQAQQCSASSSLLTWLQTAYLPISYYTQLKAMFVIVECVFLSPQKKTKRQKETTKNSPCTLHFSTTGDKAK